MAEKVVRSHIEDFLFLVVITQFLHVHLILPVTRISVAITSAVTFIATASLRCLTLILSISGLGSIERNVRFISRNIVLISFVVFLVSKNFNKLVFDVGPVDPQVRLVLIAICLLIIFERLIEIVFPIKSILLVKEGGFSVLVDIIVGGVFLARCSLHCVNDGKESCEYVSQFHLNYA